MILFLVETKIKIKEIKQKKKMVKQKIKIRIKAKIRDNAAKNRIAKWTEDRYRISNARKNWKKLSDLYDLYMNKKPLYELRQWLLTSNKMKDNNAKNRIARWTEERYRISKARKNWKKLCDLYDLYLQKRPLYEIRKRF